MNKLTCSLLVILLAIGLATRGGELQAQPPECGADDAQCLDDALALACGSKSDHASCLAWLESVEAHALTDSPEWRLIAALGYAYIPSFSDSRSEEQFYWERSAALFREVIARWPDSPYAAQANICLAGLTNDNNEAISLLREAMRADPSNTNTPYLLAARLAARGQNDDYREAPDFYRKTYSAWSGYYSAANALRLYALGGHTDQADEFRAQVERDSGMIDFAAEVVSAQFSQNQERASHVLEVACEKNIRAIFGPEVCSKGIDTLVAATRTTNYVPERRSIAGVATEGMRMLAVSGSGAAEEGNRRESEFGSVLREWIDTGAATAAVYVLWAQHRESDLDESISALERAVELAPDNGQYRYWLAQGYIAKGRFDEAVANLNLAMDTLPQNKGLTPEVVEGEIRRVESARDLRQ